MVIVGSQAGGDRVQHRDFRWLVLIGILGYLASALPLVAADCGECDAGCHLRTDAYALLEEYKNDKAGFRARSDRCSSSDATWTEISDTIQELDQPPENPPPNARRIVTKFDLMMINQKMAVSICMQLCGLERFQLDCVSGPGGKSCNCKPGAGPYCEAESNRGIVETIAPSFAATMGSAEQISSDEGPQDDDEAYGEPEPGPEPEADEEPLYLIEVTVSAMGFEPETLTAPCYVEPSSVTVEGKVVDDARMPVPGARVSLVGLGAVVRTDREGRYSLTARTEGDTPFRAERNIMIVRSIDKLLATVTPQSTVWANGREVEAVLTVLADGRPYAGKIVTLSDWKGFSRGGTSVDYVVPGRGNHYNLLLDDAGTARFRFYAPVVPWDRGATIRNPEEMFPVEGHFRVMVRNQDAETEVAYRVASPYPRVSRIRVPGNVDAGLWQVKPSTIEIEDPDSSRFTVTVRGLGDFRTTQPGAAIKKGILTAEVGEASFEFLYRPPEGGFNPSELPDALDQFMNTSKNIYFGVVTNVAGGMLLDELKVVSKGGGAMDKMLVLIGAETDAATYLDAGGNMANLINLGSGTYIDSMTVAEDSNNVQNQIVAGGNLLIGVVDTSMGFAGTLGSAQTKLMWEGAKAYWEYVKLMNSLTNQYEEIGNAYQGTRFYPIEVTVEDESGHRTIASRACSVREWKGGSQ